MTIIGITTYGRDDKFYLPPAYVDAVRSVGAVPVLLPPGEQQLPGMLEMVDGLILAGGGDIDPALYGGSGHPTIYLTDQERDTFELTLTRLALERHIPTLGICRGLQVMTVASGGDLVPHVPDEFGSEVLHRYDQHSPISHPVRVASGSRLEAIMGTVELEIASHHHQAARSVPHGWRVAAHAPDGLIEALEHEAHPWMIGLQWHPELNFRQTYHQRLLHDLVACAAQRRHGVCGLG